jgi:hypothetical protein
VIRPQHEILFVQPARLADADHLGPRLREADRREIQAVTGEEPISALRRNLLESALYYKIVSPQDSCVALFGVVPDSDFASSGFIWMLASPMLEGYARMFLRGSRPWVETLNNRYTFLWSCVDSRNARHIRWLKWCGFSLSAILETYGVERRPFYRFQRIRQEESMSDSPTAPLGMHKASAG